MQDAGLASGVQVVNVAGAGGTIGLAQFVTSKKRKGDAILVGGLVMVGAILTNKAPVSLADVTPLARLTGEYQLIVVPADSPIQSMADLTAKLKADPGCGVLGRRLGRRHRPHPGRTGRQGCRGRSDQGQLHRPLGRRRGAVGDPGRPCHRRHQRLRGVRAADRRRQAARDRDLVRRAPARRRRADPQGAGHRRLARQLARRVRTATDPRRRQGSAVRRDRQDGREPGLAGNPEDARLAEPLPAGRRVRGVPGRGSRPRSTTTLKDIGLVQ